MASVQEPLRRELFASEPRPFHPPVPRTIPILPSASVAGGGEQMDTTPPPHTSMGPPPSSPDGDRQAERPGEPPPPPPQHGHNDQHAASPPNGGGLQGAAAAAQQPKVVQTAFIHKLYNMLEDQTIQHLISWSNTNDSFVMSPSSDFSKVLAQYFKHTNISSFVRQLNMYGFHKVSDVFHTCSPESPLWEFKHGAGSFKRGDLVGLREIKRRASRHALIHRDSFSSAPKMPTPQPPGTPFEHVPDPVEARLNMLEWNFQDISTRLSRTEEAYADVSSKYQTLLDGLARCHHWSSETSSHLLTALVPDPDNPLHRDVLAMRQDIRRHLDALRALDPPQPPPPQPPPPPPHESLFPHKQPFLQLNNHSIGPTVPTSPRQRPVDESRRTSLQPLPRPPGVRAPVPAYLQGSPHRYGSIGSGGNGAAYSPSSTRPSYAQPPPPPPSAPQQPHPLAMVTMTSPPSNLSRRHTSADIRLSQAWEGNQPPPPQFPQGTSPYASGQSSGAWPSSPRGTATNPGDQQIRDTLANYQLPAVITAARSRHPSPGPPPHDSQPPPPFAASFPPSYANPNDAGWQLSGPRFSLKALDAGAPSRRSSMASNVHSLLNPADTAEREGEDDDDAAAAAAPDSFKRKRLL